MMSKSQICELCEVKFDGLIKREKHHLVPRSELAYYKKSKPAREFIFVCRVCGDAVHFMFTNEELAYIYNTLGKIKSSQKTHKYLKWRKARYEIKRWMVDKDVLKVLCNWRE